MDGENAWAGQGAVLLDIGGEIGALVVTMPGAMTHREVELAPASGQHLLLHDHGHGAHRHRPHVAVVDRPVLGPTLVFPQLVEGTYELFEKGSETVSLTVAIAGGEVTTASWPDEGHAR
jgi:hypothetical protein